MVSQAGVCDVRAAAGTFSPQPLDRGAGARVGGVRRALSASRNLSSVAQQWL